MPAVATLLGPLSQHLALSLRNPALWRDGKGKVKNLTLPSGIPNMAAFCTYA